MPARAARSRMRHKRWHPWTCARVAHILGAVCQRVPLAKCKTRTGAMCGRRMLSGSDQELQWQHQRAWRKAARWLTQRHGVCARGAHAATRKGAADTSSVTVGLCQGERCVNQSHKRVVQGNTREVCASPWMMSQHGSMQLQNEHQAVAATDSKE